ncbi:unnamed protein product [Discula destructiva]
MPSTPVFVLVPGAWHSASTWDSVISLLQERSYISHAVSLPSTSGDPRASLLDDVKTVQAVVTSHIEAGQDVIIVVHWYGGFVGESALRGLPTRSKPAANRDHGKVIGLALIGTGFTRTGVSFINALGGQPPPFWRANIESGFAELVGDTTALFYHDMSLEEGRAWTRKLLPQSLKSLFEGGEQAYMGWQDVPVWYLITLEDRGLPVEVQRWMANDAREQGADVTTREIGSGHCPMLSRCEETVEFLIEAATALDG